MYLSVVQWVVLGPHSSLVDLELVLAVLSFACFPYVCEFSAGFLNTNILVGGLALINYPRCECLGCPVSVYSVSEMSAFTLLH